MRTKFLIFLGSLIASFTLQSQTLLIESGATLTTGAGTVLDVDGDLNMNGTLDLLSTAQLELEGDFVINQATSFSPRLGFHEGNSTVTFNGTSAQFITSASLSDLSEFFYNMTIDNPTTVKIDTTKFNLISLVNIIDPKQGTFITDSAFRLRASTNSFYARVAEGTGDISGDVIIEKQLTNTNAGWRQLSMPLTGSWQDGGWSGIPFLFSDHTPAGQRNAFRWNAARTNVGITDTAVGWVAAAGTTLGSTPLDVFLKGGSSLFDVSDPFSCSGELRDSDASFGFSLEYTRDPGDLSGTNDDAKGWNHLPNPWAALIDVQELLTSVQSNAFDPTYKAIHVYNSVTNQYEAILLNNTVTKIGWNTDGTTINDADANIPPLQSFWVKANETGQNVTLYADEMQTTSFKNPSNEQFMKKNPEVIRLDVFDQDSLWDQLVIYFDVGKTRDFDNIGDAYFLRSQLETTPIFYGIEGGSKASIIGRPQNSTDSVQVVFGSTKDQSKFHIQADLDELGDDWFVYLKDKKNNQTYQLNHNESLNFSHFNGLATERFVVYFSKQENTFNYLVSDEQREVISFIRNDELILQSTGIHGPITISVFDATGRLLNKIETEIQLSEEMILEMNRTNQLIFIQITAGGQVFNNKVFY